MTTTETTEMETTEVQAPEQVHLPLGLLGFERMKEYLLIAEPGQEPFKWLQVHDDPSLAFLVLSPFEVVPNYQPDLSQDDVNFIGLERPEDAVIYNIVTVRTHGRATMNLKGPIVLNRRTLRGKQVVLVNAAQYSLQHPLPAAE